MFVLLVPDRGLFFSQNADSGIAPLGCHGCDDLPGVDNRVVTFDAAEEGVSIISGGETGKKYEIIIVFCDLCSAGLTHKNIYSWNCAAEGGSMLGWICYFCLDFSF